MVLSSLATEAREDSAELKHGDNSPPAPGPALTVGSLFSGIGGLDLGLERTGGFRTIWFCENDEYCNAVLRKHWPNVPNLGDIREVKWDEVERPDMLIGGFPCQDISIAGKHREGIHGARSGLWKEFSRAIEGLRPEWVIIENSPQLIKRGLGCVLQDLRDAGYEPLRPLLLRASEVGARHRRERLLLPAHIDLRGGDDGDAVGQWEQVLQNQIRFGQKNQQEQHERKRGFGTNSKVIADAVSVGKERNVAQEVYGKCGVSWWHDNGEFEEIREGRHLLEPLVCREVYGVSRGMDRIKCLGNAVVPACAEVIGEAVLAFERARSPIRRTDEGAILEFDRRRLA
jgi:DNA (cytosine-5)-methyltransferase 1